MNIFLKIALVFGFILLFGSTIGQDLILKKKKNKWGYTNTKGEWIIKPKYKDAKPFKNGYAAVKTKKWGFIKADGKYLVKPTFSDVHSFSNEMAAVRSYKPLAGDNRSNHNQYKWGFINNNGELVINYVFKGVKDFNNDKCLATLFKLKEGEFYYIDKTGKAISPPFTKKTEKNNYYLLENQRNDGNKVYCYIKKTGEPITGWYLNKFELLDTVKVWLPSDSQIDTIPTSAFKGNANKKLCAFINKKGEVLSDWYTEIKPFKKGYAPVRRNNLYGFIDQNYNIIKKPKYREVEYLSNNRYKAQTSFGRSVLINLKGKELSDYCYDFDIFDDSLYVGIHQLKSSYRNETKYALYDSLGKQKTGWYNKIHRVRNYIVRVEDERLFYQKGKPNKYKTHYNYVNITSGELISKWRVASTISWENKKIEKDSLLTYLFLARPSFLLSDFIFKTIFIKEFEYSNDQLKFAGGDFHNGKALVSIAKDSILWQKNNITFYGEQTKYGYIDWYGKQTITYKYNEAAAFRDGFAVVGNGEKYGAINEKGKLILPYNYLFLGGYGSGLFPILNQKGKWGYINTQKRIQIKEIYNLAMPFSYGYASAKKGRYWGLIDVMGNEILPFIYRKPIEMISPHKVRLLENGIGYIEKNISELIKK